MKNFILFVFLLCVIEYIDARGYPGPKNASAPFLNTTDYKTTDCRECLVAGGRMCSYKDGSSMVKLTESSKSKHGICCNPLNKEADCGFNDRNLVCGPPSNLTYTPAD